jgi:hypothetical protein
VARRGRDSIHGYSEGAATRVHAAVIESLLDGIIRVVLRQVSGLPQPVLDDLAHDRSIPGRSAAAQWICCPDAPAERRPADCYDDQPFLVVDAFADAEKLDVNITRYAAGPHADAGHSQGASTPLPDLGAQPPTELGGGQRDLCDAVVERERAVHTTERQWAGREVCEKATRCTVDDGNIGCRDGVADGVRKDVSERRTRIAAATDRRLKRHAKRGGLQLMDAVEGRLHRADDAWIGCDGSSFVLGRYASGGRRHTVPV